MKNALIISVNDFLEHDFTMYNKSVFLGETASVVDSHKNWESTVLDVTYQHLTLSDLIPLFLSKPELILFYTETNQSRMTFRLAEIAKKISPIPKILVFGLATTFIPHYFSRYPFDAIHVSGDREAAISSYINYLDKIITETELEGLRIIQKDGTVTTTKIGRWLDQSEWAIPKLSKLPLNSYLEFQKRRKNVVDCKLGLAITATKGCESKCNFCGCSEEEGTKDRTRDPEIIFKWFDENSNYIDDTFHLYSPNIISSPDWVKHFHSIYTQRGYKFFWQGVTRTNTLNEEVVALASEAGLRKLSIGIEHISTQMKRPIKSSLDELAEASRLSNKYNIILVGLLMLGYPNQTIEDIKYILSILKEFKIKYFRFTGYTPLHKLRNMTTEELDRIFIEDYDRRTFYADDMRITPKQFYDILISNGKCLAKEESAETVL